MRTMSEFSSPTSIGLYFIVEVIAVVVGSLAVYYLLKGKDKVKIIIQSVRKDDKLGFAVNVERKTVKHAQVRCNDIDYDWENQNGDLSHETTLWAGDNRPQVFFPYRSGVVYVEDISKYGDIKVIGCEGTKGGILIFVEDVKTQKILYQFPSRLIKGFTSLNATSSTSERHIEASIKIIGEGMEERRDYQGFLSVKKISIPVIVEEKPLLNKITYEFGFKLKRKHFGLL